MGSCVSILSPELESVAVITYFDAQIVPDFGLGSPFLADLFDL